MFLGRVASGFIILPLLLLLCLFLVVSWSFIGPYRLVRYLNSHLGDIRQHKHILNKNNKEDKELIEDYCEEQLLYYYGFKSIRPECCKVCGRLIKYTVVLNKRTWE